MRRYGENVTVVETVVESFKCDACGKVERVRPQRNPDPPTGWVSFHVFTPWPDVEDSADVCGWECYREAVARVVDEWEDTDVDVSIDGKSLGFMVQMVKATEQEG